MGTVIADRYVLRERLASGSTGEAWLASALAAGDRPVVVKLLAEDIETPVRGTPLIELIEHGRTGGRIYLVLEYAPGGSLRDVLRREGRLSQAEAMAVLARAATLLHEAHLSGLLHRDVRPGHLLLRGDGSLAITDAGLAPGWWSPELTGARQALAPELMGARQALAPEPATATRWAARAPYLAPEQVRGASITAATDVYALGVVGYECLAGRPPFDGPTAAATATRHTVDEPPPLPPDIAPAVGEVVLRALAKDPARRWPTAQALAEAATRAAASLPSPADPAGTAAQFRAVAGGGPAPEPAAAPEFRVVRAGTGEPAALPDRTPAPARVGTLVTSAAARAVRTPTMNRMPAMNANETTLDNLPPVPPEWDQPRRPRGPQPRYLAIAAGAAAILVVLVIAVPGLTSRGNFSGVVDPPTPIVEISFVPPGPHPTNPEPSPPDLAALLPSLLSAAPTPIPPGPGAGPGPGAPTTTVPGNPAPPAPPTAPGVITFKVAGTNPSPQFKEGSCVYRIWYANYGSTAFGKLRIYSGGGCLSASVQVAAARGSVVTYESVGTPFISQNSDSCGSYFEIQATGASTPAIAVGMSIRFAATGRTVVFASDRGVAPTMVRNC